MIALAEQWILTLLMVVPAVGAIMVVLGHRDLEPRRVARRALLWSMLVLAVGVVALVLYWRATDGNTLVRQHGGYGLNCNVSWVSDQDSANPAAGGAARYVDLRYHVGVDGLSIWLVLLTVVITPLCIWGSFTAIRSQAREFHALLLVLEAALVGVFIARDLLLFYIAFEFTLIPLFLLIGIWGGPQRRPAAVKFLLYTLAGSLLTLVGVIYLAYLAYSLPGEQGGSGVFTFDLEALYRLHLTASVQWWVFLAFAAGFAIKVPLFPFHTWLSLAHTEAPTAGSVILAGVLLKLGTYGFLRLSLPLVPDAAMSFAPLMATLAIVGILYAALVAWVQQDFKRLIAYSSVSHLGFCILGMFSMTTAGLSGSLLHMVNHGLSTGALFLVVGMIYERYHTRAFRDLGGLARVMPRLAFFLVVFTLASIGLPGLNGFVSEFLVLVGTFTSARGSLDWPPGPLGVPYAVAAAVGVILSAVYMLALCQRLLFGPLRQPEGTPDASHGLPADLNRREMAILTPLAVLCLVLGMYPQPVLRTVHASAERQILPRVFGYEPADDEQPPMFTWSGRDKASTFPPLQAKTHYLPPLQGDAHYLPPLQGGIKGGLWAADVLRDPENLPLTPSLVRRGGKTLTTYQAGGCGEEGGHRICSNRTLQSQIENPNSKIAFAPEVTQ